MLQNQYRRVVALLLVLFTIGSTNIPGPSTAHAQTSDIIVKDKDDPNVEWGGTPGYFYDAGPGSVVASGHAMWTGSNANSPDNFVKWKPPLPECGIYEVFAYIPWIENGKADTTNAVYKIRHRGNETTRAVNMRAVNDGFGRSRTDRWHSLGTYVFSKDANSVGEYVLLGDTTGESGIQSVNFDDMRWVKQPGGGAVCAALPPPPPPVDGIIVKDKDDPNVEWGGTPGYFYDAGPGSVVANGHAMWTGSNANSPDNFVKWKPPLPECGTYEVFAYIPWIENGRADTTNAVYKIRYRGGETTKAVNMRAINDGFGSSRTDRWHSLGTYLFSKDANSLGEHVLLGDTTGESGIQSVNFDDMRWVKRVGGGAVCAALPPPPPPVEGIIVKDKDDPNVERGGTAAYLYNSPAGSVVSNNHGTWTGSNANNPDNYIKWKPPLDRCGNWEVFAYMAWIENGKADTTNAVYKIRHRNEGTPGGIEETRTINMDQVNKSLGSTRTDRWLSLGTYLWSAGANNAGEYVWLGDSTGETTIRSVNFDDMRWIYRSSNDSACNAPRDATAPDGRITSPQNNSSISPASVNVTADAWDNPGGSGVNRVDFHVFYDDSWHFLGSDSSAPYSIEWGTPSGLTSQQLRFTIHVYDNAGNRTIDPGGYSYVNYQAPTAQQIAVLVHGYQQTGISNKYKYTCKNSDGQPNIVPYDGNDSEFWRIAEELHKNDYTVYHAFWDTGTRTPNLGSMSNCLRDEILKVKDQDPDKKVTIVAHSLGGIVSRGYIEGSDFAKDGEPVDKLITFGSPHTGINSAALLLLVCPASPALCQVNTQWMTYFNLTHKPSGKIPYAFVGGTEPGSSWLKGLLSATEGPNDGLIGAASATGHSVVHTNLGTFIARSVGGSNVQRWQTKESHVPAFGTGYFNGEEALKCLREFLNLSASPRGCTTYQPATLSAQDHLRGDELADETSISRSYVGTLQRGESRTFPIRLDGNAAQVVLSYSQGDLDFTLTAPDGSLITGKDAAQLLTAGSYEQYPGSAFPPLAVYSMQNPTAGEWNATITATNVVTETNFALYGVLASPTTLSVDDLRSVGKGERLPITARLTNNGVGITGATVDAAVITPGGTSYVTLRAAQAGVYVGEIVAPTEPGQYQVSVRASGTPQAPFTRQDDLILYVRADDVQGDGTPTVQAIDNNSNGRYDLLKVTVPLKVKIPSAYLVSATLHTSDGQVITTTNVQTTLNSGAQTLTLTFDGRAIGQSGKSGPYAVDLLIMSADQLQLSMDEQSLVQTSPYKPNQFEEGAVKAYLPFTRR